MPAIVFVRTMCMLPAAQSYSTSNIWSNKRLSQFTNNKKPPGKRLITFIYQILSNLSFIKFYFFFFVSPLFKFNKKNFFFNINYEIDSDFYLLLAMLFKTFEFRLRRNFSVEKQNSFLKSIMPKFKNQR